MLADDLNRRQAERAASGKAALAQLRRRPGRAVPRVPVVVHADHLRPLRQTQDAERRLRRPDWADGGRGRRGV
jgi:hypothetical protein